MRRSNARSPAFDPLMDPSKLQSRQSPTSSTRFSLLSRLTSHPNPKHRSNLWIAVSFLSFLAAILCIFSFLRSDGDRRYGIVIDGGSTGTRIHVYSYVPAGRMAGSLPVVVDVAGSATMKVNPGLSAYADNPEKAGESLRELIDFARRSVRRNLWAVTEVRLMATAGMRLLDVGVQEKILDSCRRVLRSSGFQFRRDWATVISGRLPMIAGPDEGIYAWVTANYALATLGGDPQKTSGIIELGGASAQITFVSSESLPSEFSHVLRFGKTTYNLYSHSFLHLGQNVAYDALQKSLGSGIVKSYPCTPRGYPLDQETGFSDGLPNFESGHATGNYSECRSSAMMLLQEGKDRCSYKNCNIGSIFVPELRGRFLATENFFYTSKLFGLDSTSHLSDMVMAGERFCAEDWLELQKKFHFIAEEDLVRYCFSSAYIVAMLHDSLGIPLDDRRIGFANQVGGVPLDWALGAFIMSRISDTDMEQPESITSVIHDNSKALVSAIAMSILILTVWWVSKWKKPQLKTIYDLEKGRYIITRVSP